MSKRHPDEQLWNDIVQDDELDRFFDESEASLVARAEQHVRRTSAPWKRPGIIGLAVGLMITSGAAWSLLTQHGPDVVVPTTTPRTTVAMPTVAPTPAPASGSTTNTPTAERFSTQVSATSTSNNAALIERADSLQGVVSNTSDVHQTPTMWYTIGVLRHRAGQVEASRRALAEAEHIAMQMKLDDLLDKIRREQTSLPSR
ncbi:MAG: hypothetical protein JSS89_05650 [Bacteroidetes bacterium]|nr:hypothetical protein [Bacteroidota bacterium]